MRNLKKLSLAFLLTTLFSISFTSCIDTDVDPAVEAIYAAQADLIAAQTAVQNAEADYLAAQAAAEQADADYRAAQTAQLEVQTAGYEADNAYEAAQREQYLLALVASTNLQVAQSQNALAIANANFDIQMAQLMAQLEAAGVQLAMQYANSYASAMNQANSLYSQLLTAQNNLANAELMQESTSGFSYAYYLAGLQGAVDNAMAAKAVIEGNIATLEATIADPASLEAGLTQLKDDKAALEEARDLKDLAIAEQQAVIDELIEQNDNVRGDLIDRIDLTQLDNHNASVNEKNANLNLIEGLEADILAYQAALDDYDGIKATLEQAVVDAEDRIGFDGVGSALDHEHNHPVAFGLLGDIDAATTALGPLNTAVTNATNALGTPDTPVLGDSPYSPANTAYKVLFNAELAVIDHDADYAALTATYNAAATALAAAQTAFDGNTYAADLATAQSNLTTAQGNLTTAQATYDSAKTAFDADTNGSVTTDSDGNHSAGQYAVWNSTFDLGEIGIDTDAAPDTYMRVATWKETTLGSGDYIPATLFPTKYNTADLAVEVTALIADAGNGIAANADVWLWEDDSAPSAMPINDFDGNPAVLGAGGVGSNADLHAFGSADAIDANAENIAVFINVESDDTSVSNLYTFNVATNMLGNDDFSTRPFSTSGAGTIASPYVFNAVLTPASASAGYDSTPDADGEADSAFDMLTAQAEVWNAGLEVFKKQNAFDLGDDALIAAQAVYDAQKLLFDEGLVTRAGLVAAAEAVEDAGGAVFVALANLSAANAAVTAQGNVISALQHELGYTEYITTGTAGAGQVLRTLNTGNLFISWDVHANDGVPAADVMFEYLASAGWETGYDGDGAMGDADANTAYAELWNAQEALARHTATTAAQYQTMINTAEGNIADYQAEIVQLDQLIAALYAEVAGMFAQLDEAGITYTFTVNADGTGTLEFPDTGIFTGYDIDIQVLLIEARQVAWNLQFERDAMTFEIGQMGSMITAYENAYGTDDVASLVTALETAQGSLPAAMDLIELAEQALASGQVEEDAAAARIGYLQALVDDILARHANQLAIAAEYEALMLAALGN